MAMFVHLTWESHARKIQRYGLSLGLYCGFHVPRDFVRSRRGTKHEGREHVSRRCWK